MIPSLIKKLRAHRVSVLLVLAVILVYAGFASPGESNQWVSSTNYYDFLARGFLKGNLHLDLDPDPKILALSNPYDPQARARIEINWDLSLYQGRYYMYWGPVPALILSGIHLVYPGTISDLFLAFVFVSGVFAVQVLLILTLWNRYFHRLPRLLLYVSILLIGLAGPLLLLRHNYESGRIYEASITGGQFFFMSGIFLALSAMSNDPVSVRRLTAASFLWMLAIGTRQILAVPIGFMMLLLAFQLLRSPQWSWRKSMQFIPVVLPLVFGVICQAWYNWARFGSCTESGLYYQLAGVNLRSHYDELFSPAYIFQNLYNYLFNALEFSNTFPFVTMPLGTESFSYFSGPDLYSAEPMAGLVYTFPFLLFAGLPFPGSASKRVFVSSLDRGKRLFWRLTTLALGGSFLITFGLLLLFFWAGMRYLEDFLPCLTTLSIIGFWQGYPSSDPGTSSGKSYISFGILLASVCILLNVLLAISMHQSLVVLITRLFQSP